MSTPTETPSDPEPKTRRTRATRQSEQPRVAKKSTATVEPKPATPPPVYTTRRQQAMANRKARLSSDAKKILADFDPETSTRERRKISRKIAARRTPGALFDENGVHIASDTDLCDCLQVNCPGCHFPCKKCTSKKCGLDCRNNRKFVYEEIEYHGYDFVVSNPLLK